MRRLLIPPVLMLLCSLLAGCFAIIPKPVASDPQTDYEEMEIYQNLRNAVTEESTLEEILNAFSEMCKIPVETQSEMFLFEVYPSEFEGAQHLNLHIVRQVDDPGTDEYIQLHLDIIYLLDEDLTAFRETTWFDRDAEGFVEYIRNGAVYQTLIGKPIQERYVSIGSTW